MGKNNIHQWKLSFNPDPNMVLYLHDPNKQATEVLYSRKVNSDDHPNLTFNGKEVQQCSSQKYWGVFLDNKIDFDIHHLDEKINVKCNKITGMMKKISPSVSKHYNYNL